MNQLNKFVEQLHSIKQLIEYFIVLIETIPEEQYDESNEMIIKREESSLEHYEEGFNVLEYILSSENDMKQLFEYCKENKQYCLYNIKRILEKLIPLQKEEDSRKGYEMKLKEIRSQDYHSPTNSLIKQSNLKENEIKQLEDWTGLKCSEIVFDSRFDNWDINTSTFNKKLLEKNQLLFIVEDEDCELFGYYLENHLCEWKESQSSGMKSFHFNLRSNGRLNKPMKFEPINEITNLYKTCSDDSNDLIVLGDMRLCKQQRKQLCEVLIYGEDFNYHDISKALCGKESCMFDAECFTLRRLIVIQMK